MVVSWYSQYYGRKGDTLLDGEIVQHRKTMRRMFLLFDIVALNDVYVGQLHLNERLKRISHVVMEFRKQMSRMSQSAMRVLPFELIGKTFFPCNEAGIEALQKCIEKVCHLSDLLICDLHVKGWERTSFLFDS